MDAAGRWGNSVDQRNANVEINEETNAATADSAAAFLLHPFF